MAKAFDDAVARLYQAAHGEFVAERKRLANELAKGGDKPAAALFAKLPRPSISAWVINQLFWRKRALFDAFLASAARLRAGELAAAAEHRKQSAALVNDAAVLLKEAGNAASEATLRRVGANLAAIAAAGGFDPDPAGAMKSDRDPPGFDAFAGADAFTPSAAPTTATAKERAEPASAKAEVARTRAQIEAERRRVAEEQARVRAERRELETALRTAQTAVERRNKERERLKSELEKVEDELEQALVAERELEQRLAQLPNE